MEENFYTPKNIKECDRISWCSEYGKDGINLKNCPMRAKFIIDKADITNQPKNDKYITYKWYNVRNVGQLKESLTLVPDDVEIDIDFRFVENLTKNKKELQYQIPREPRNPETL